ncbi:MAG: aminotransferase class V-fold PLP-dependent enzyme [Pyrinomonadaceae bacterium]
MNRRNFLYLAGVSAAAATGARLGSAATISAAETKFDPMKWESVREQFDLLANDQIHLSSFFLTSHPRQVREEIERHRSAIDASPLEYIEKNMFTMPGKIAANVAEYLGGKPEEVAITNSTTMGLALIYHGLPLRTGDEILTTAHDHFVHHEAARLAAERAGGTVRKVPLYLDPAKASADEMVERIRNATSSRTRVVGVTWVHSGTGVKLPIRQIATVIEEINRKRTEADRVILIVDGVHGFGIEDEAVAELGADFFVAGTHKWIFGPRGTGIVWAKASAWKRLRLVFPAFAEKPFAAWATDTKLTAPTEAAWVTQGGFHAFEYEWALPAAFEFHRQIGRARISERIHGLNDRCKEGLASIRNVRLYTPLTSKLSAGIICFEISGMESKQVVARLHEKKIIASTAPYRESYARLAPSLMNTPEEVEAALRAVRSIAIV